MPQLSSLKFVKNKKHIHPYELGPQTGDEFYQWRDNMVLGQQEAALFLDYSVRMIQRWEAGTHEIPRSVSLACEAAYRGTFGPISYERNNTEQSLEVAEA